MNITFLGIGAGDAPQGTWWTVTLQKTEIYIKIYKTTLIVDILA